ncbi:MAG: NUDIX domain-containing protein [Firmicutes bacterium]|nr:NUDIX domain-containing protein [Bacillota bacterium]
MSYEKSCGAVLVRNNSGRTEYLLVLNQKGKAIGHWGFPKGHVEANETEHETAKREIFEETGIKAEFIDGFREVSTYSPEEGVTKDVVYFLANPVNDDITIQESEIADFLWCDFGTAQKTLTFDNDILKKANRFLIEKEIISI